VGGLSAEDERELDNPAATIEQQNVFAAPDGQEANEAEAAGPGNRAVRARRTAAATPHRKATICPQMTRCRHSTHGSYAPGHAVRAR
jgi:hypothetical protein